jgi:transposase
MTHPRSCAVCAVASISKFYVNNSNSGILIDSISILDDNIPYFTSINNHNGIISNESRLIYVVDKKTHLPIFFNFMPGNIVDFTTLKTTIDKLNSYNISVKYSILDAGYYSENNIKYLYENNISFITRLIPNYVIYKYLINDELNSIMSPENAMAYNNRLIFITRKQFMLLGYTAYAYICIDAKSQREEYLAFIQTPQFNSLTVEEKEIECKKLGLFILISTEKFDKTDILPLYYNRQTIEQIFDIHKNNCRLLPQRVYSEEAFKGHLLISFMATIVSLQIQNMLKNSAYDASLALYELYNLHCNLYSDTIVINKLNERMKKIVELLDLNLPLTWPVV